MNRFSFALAAGLLMAGTVVAAPTQRLPTEHDASLLRADAASEEQAAERRCLHQTGSRIVRRQKDGCLAGAGRTYDRRDLDSTGETRAGHALQLLDPTIRPPR